MKTKYKIIALAFVSMAFMAKSNPAHAAAADYQAVIDSNEAQKAQIQKDLDAAIKKADAGKQKTIDSLDAQISALSKNLSDLAKLGSGSDVANALFSSPATDAKAANEATADQMFLTKDQILTPETMDKLNLNRNRIALQNAIDSIAQSMKLKLTINPSNDMAQHIKENTALQDGTTDALSQSTMARIEEMKVILNIVRLKALDLKAETSAEIVGMQRYQRVIYGDDQSTIDLCNYQKSPDSSAGAKK